MTEPTPPPTPKPAPCPIPKPHPAGVVKLVPSRSDSVAAEAAVQGRVDDEGSMWPCLGDGERTVGQYAAEGSKKDILTIYVRRYLDLEAQLALIEARVETVNPEESASALQALDEQIVELLAVGDIEGLRNRSATLASRISELRAEHKVKRGQAKVEARVRHEALVECAEAIAASANTSINRRDTRAELMELSERWKDVQKNGPRISRSTNDTLWKRLSHVRKVFKDARRVFFVGLEKEHAYVVAVKERLTSEAEAIAKLIDWREMNNRMRHLMDEWKAAGRMPKHDNNALRERFMAVREVFFSARSTHHATVDQEFANNLATKLELLAEAEALLPIDDLDATRAAYHDTGECWEVISMVPHSNYSRVEGRMRQIADEICYVENEQWRWTDPEKKQRSTGMTVQLEVLIVELDGEIAAVKGAGDEAEARELNEARQA